MMAPNQKEKPPSPGDRIAWLERERDDILAELQTYKEQHEDDTKELKQVRDELSELLDWQDKAVSQMARVLLAWDNEIDANILTELETLRELMIEGRAQMGVI